MSNPPTPPPIPPTPPTPPPFPAQPIPVQPLGYGRPPAYGRPGILTAVAVISIVVASFSLLVSGAIGLYGGVMMAASRFARTASVTTTTTSPTPPVATTPAPDESAATDNADDGMPEASRKVVVEALAGLRPLSDERQKHLDALLAKSGKKALPLSGDALTRRAVQANVTDAGQFPSGTGKASAGADYFAVALGRIEVDDRHAVFYPLAGGDVIRASASEDEAADAGTPATTPGPGTALSNAEVREVVATIEKRSGHKLNAVQAQTLRQQLTVPSQTMFIPNVPVAKQVKTALWMNNKAAGTSIVTFSTMTGSMSLPSNGGVSTWSSSGGFATGGPVMPNIVRQAALVVASAVVSLALAVLLLVAGIMTLRDSRAARRLHLIYAWVKLPIGVVGMIAWGWMWYSLMAGLAGGGGPSPARGVSVVFTVPIILGMIYPIALLIVMHTRGVKAYYNPAGPG